MNFSDRFSFKYSCYLFDYFAKFSALSVIVFPVQFILVLSYMTDGSTTNFFLHELRLYCITISSRQEIAKTCIIIWKADWNFVKITHLPLFAIFFKHHFHKALLYFYQYFLETFFNISLAFSKIFKTIRFFKSIYKVNRNKVIFDCQHCQHVCAWRKSVWYTNSFNYLC